MEHQPNSGWIWPTPTPTKRKAEHYDSWEERAFAEDAAGVLGSSGCVWPPRSYTCTFCRREFRSAQALGGHMNVHRRDRARLKQLPNAPQSPPDTTCSKPDVNYKKCPSEGFATLVYGTNPNPNNSNTLLQSFGPNLRPNYAKAKIVEGVNSKCLNSELSICLNLVVRSNIEGDDQQEAKRRKIVATSPEPSPSLIFDVNHNSKINTHCSTSSREIDLELRL